MKFRRDRRPELPLEPVWSFYPKYWTETAVKIVRWATLYLRLRRIYLAIKHDPNRYAYTDIAMTPVRDDEADTHEMFQTDVAKAFVGHQQHVRDAQAARSSSRRLDPREQPLGARAGAGGRTSRRRSPRRRPPDRPRRPRSRRCAFAIASAAGVNTSLMTGDLRRMDRHLGGEAVAARFLAFGAQARPSLRKSA